MKIWGVHGDHIEELRRSAALCPVAWWFWRKLFFSPMEHQFLVGQGLLIEASRLYSDTPHSIGPFWSGDQPDAATSTWQHTQHEKHILALGGIRTHNPSKRAVPGPRIRPRGHCRLFQAIYCTRTMTVDARCLKSLQVCTRLRDVIPTSLLAEVFENTKFPFYFDLWRKVRVMTHPWISLRVWCFRMIMNAIQLWPSTKETLR